MNLQIASSDRCNLHSTLENPFKQNLVLLDLETTGANVLKDRITEIALIRFEQGHEVARWQTLVNPQSLIPPYIQKIVGITDDMVTNAPMFEQLAPTLLPLLTDATLVAHNARFDYGFLYHAYQRLQHHLTLPVLCSIKLSRALYPKVHKHGLDAIIERFQFTCHARHRAMGDVEVLVQFFNHIQQQFDLETLKHAYQQATKPPKRPPCLPPGTLEGLPERSGIFEIYGSENKPLILGKTENLRGQLMSLLTNDKTNKKNDHIYQQARTLNWETTAGPIDSEIKLLERQKTLNLSLPKAQQYILNKAYAIQLHIGKDALFKPFLIENSDPVDWQDIYGSFHQTQDFKALLKSLAKLYPLCPIRLGLETNKNGCSNLATHRCLGVCVGKESFLQHDQRLLAALNSVKLIPWPWKTPRVIVEKQEDYDQVAYHLIDHWCLLCSTHDLDNVHRYLASPYQRTFSSKIYTLLSRFYKTSAQSFQDLKSLNT